MMVFGPDGDIQTGCGITVTDMEVSTHGDMGIIITGLGHFLITEEYMTRSTLFGDIMTPSILDLVMVMDTDMVIILGGGHTTLGTIMALTEETLIQMFHS